VRRLDSNGLDAWAQVVAKGWEGLVAKDEASPYVLGAHTRRWVKVKHRIRQGWPGEGVEYRRE
jgi:ATP-dependent DNA ligase